MIQILSLENLKVFWFALIVSAVLSKPILSLLDSLKSRQTVSQHAPEGHQLKQGTPTMGGIIILVGFFFGSIYEFFLGSRANVSILVLVALFALIGFVDDFVVPRMMPGKRGLGWKQKIIMQFVCAVIPFLIYGESQVGRIAIGVFVILFFANAFNFSDGLDGLAGTILLGMLLGLIGISSLMGISLGYALLPAFALLGGLIPFLYWNAPKAKVFMGDVGSLPIGAFLGGFWFLNHIQVSITASSPLLWALILWSIMMAVELLPVPIQIGSVKLRKKKVFPYTPIHHAFEKAGWPETRVVFVFAIAQFLCSMAAITVMVLASFSSQR